MQIIIFMTIAFMIGYFVGNFNKKVRKRTSIIPTPNHVDHLEPRYYGYHGQFANNCLCTECHLQGLYEDIHPTNPCPRCGGKVKELTQGYKWQERNGVMQWLN